MDQLLDKLFESTAKARLLKLFLMNPEREFVMPEIVKQTQLKKSAVQKELAKLMRLGLVRTRTVKDNKREQKTARVARITKIARVAKAKKATKVGKKKMKVAKETKSAKATNKNNRKLKKR